MHILVTNDDGVTSPGLFALVQEARMFGDVTVLAPDRNWSGGGHVKTIDRPLRIREVPLADGTLAFTSDGAPSDCVALALLGYLKKPVDLVLSGINTSANLGHDVTYSGTVTAAMESVIWGVPAIAISLNAPTNAIEPLDYGPAARLGCQVAEKVLKSSLPSGILLNVNIPYLPEMDIKGFLITRQGLRVYRDRVDQRVDPRGQLYYWIGGDAPTGIPEVGTDFGALTEGYVSITPLQLDLTAYPALQVMKSWELKPNNDRVVSRDRS
jgi:5'-nucleotidase